MNPPMAGRFNFVSQAAVQLSFQGHLLVAAPSWRDDLFERVVCLVVQHGPQGAVGILLNRSLGAEASGLWQHLAAGNKLENKLPLHFGGPQSGPVVAVHNRRELAEFTSAEGVYFAAQIHHLQQLVASSPVNSAVKIIVGQADWKAGQLETEFMDGKWLPLPVSSKLVFADETTMWSQAMREIGNHLVKSMTGSRGAPKDVLAN
jgi:putative transcriptional regulator